MKKLILFCILLISVHFCIADDTNLLKDGKWIKNMRTDHPRMFLTNEMLPLLRARVKNDLREPFEKMRKEVDALPDDAPIILKPELFRELSDGKIKPIKPSQQGQALFRYNGGEQAVKSALIYLITNEKRYLDKTKSYLRLANHVFQWTAQNNIWVDLNGNTRINALTAFDWIYNDLTPNERKEILQPIFEYITNSKSGGSYKFRRTRGSAIDGNYGENALQWFAGLAGYGAGVDDVKAEKMLRNGATLFVNMMDYRERVSGGSGLLSAITPTYSFGQYPYATFSFFHTWKSAFNEDLSERWKQMLDYPNWFDWAAIKLLPDGRILWHGIGDVQHSTNTERLTEIYTHLAQSIHFYSNNYPDEASKAYTLQSKLPERYKVIRQESFPFLPFILSNFNPTKEVKEDPSKVKQSRYFFNSSFGLLLLRSGRSDTDTYASFRFGSSLVNHQHYDELSFIIYKGNFLALDAGSRTENAHHHNFAAQSVAHNTILIHQPKEKMPSFWKPWGFKPDSITYYNHGGQFVKDMAKSIALQSTEDFIYAAGDATKSYLGDKSKEVVRQFVYLKPNIFVIYDRVTSVTKDQRKEFLIHFQNEPVKLNNNSWRADHEGRLFIKTLLPEKPTINLVGGPGREFEASGRNWELPGGKDWDKPMKLTGKWRLEISDSNINVHTAFLHILEAAINDKKQMVSSSIKKTTDYDILELTDLSGTRWELKFNRSGEIGLLVKQTLANGKIIFNGILPNQIEK